MSIHSSSALVDAAPRPVQRSSGASLPFPRRIRFDSGWLLAVVGCSYAIGFVVVNAHMGRFRPLEYDLLEARYLAAALLFVATSVPPMVVMLLASGIIHQPPHGVARSWPRWKLWCLRGFRCLLGVIIGYLFWGFLVDVAAISGGFKWTRDALGFYAGLVFLWAAWESAVLIRKLDPAPEPFAISVIMGVLAFGMVGLFGVKIFPNLEPTLGGGGAWVATLVPEADALPGELVARTKPEAMILELDGDDLSLLLCAADPRAEPEPVVIARSKFASITVREMVAVGEFGARCAESRRATPPPASAPRPGV